MTLAGVYFWYEMLRLHFFITLFPFYSYENYKAPSVTSGSAWKKFCFTCRAVNIPLRYQCMVPALGKKKNLKIKTDWLNKRGTFEVSVLASWPDPHPPTRSGKQSPSLGASKIL